MKYLMRVLGTLLLVGALVMFYLVLTYETVDLELGELRDIFGRQVAEFTVFGFPLRSVHWAGAGWFLFDLAVFCVAVYWGLRLLFWGED